MSPQRAQSLRPEVRADGTRLGHVPLERHLPVWGVVCCRTFLLVEGCLSVWEIMPTSKHFFSSCTVSLFLCQKRRATPPSISPHGALSLCRPRRPGHLAYLLRERSLSQMEHRPSGISPHRAPCFFLRWRPYHPAFLFRALSVWGAIYLSACLSSGISPRGGLVYLFEKARRPENISRLPALYLRCSTFSGISHYGELLACLKKRAGHLPFLLRALSMTEKEADIQNFSS